jgi:hypothetical protein
VSAYNSERASITKNFFIQRKCSSALFFALPPKCISDLKAKNTAPSASTHNTQHRLRPNFFEYQPVPMAILAEVSCTEELFRIKIALIFLLLFPSREKEEQ